MLRFLKPYSDETLTGFVYRTAKENRMDNLSWILECFEKDSSIRLKEFQINWLKGRELEMLANYVGLDYQEAYKITVIYEMDKLGLDVGNVLKNQVFIYSKTRFCPRCLQESTYHRKIWLNCHSIICLKHFSFLKDSCDGCEHSPTIKAIINDKCHKCKRLLSKTSIQTVKSETLINYQKLISDIFVNKKFSYNHLWIKNPSVFIKAINFFSLYTASLINSDLFSIVERHHLKNYKTINQSIALYGFVFDLLSNWPSSFYDFLNVAEKNNETKFLSIISRGIPKLIGSDMWHISKELNSYLVQFKFNLPSKEYIRSDEIKYIDQRFNGNIVNSNLFITYKQDYKGIKFVLIDINDVKKTINRMDNSITKSELIARWGTSAVSTFNILQSDLLNESFTFDSGSINKWIIPITSVYKLEDALQFKSTSSIQNPITFHAACKWAGPHKAHLLIKGILNGLIDFKIQNKKLALSLLNRQQCYKLIRENIIMESKNKGFIRIRDLVFILGVKKSDVVHWIETGRFGDLNGSIETIPYENFSIFNSTYLTTLELSLKVNLKISQILTMVRHNKLFPQSGPDLLDGKRLLFYR
jgi:hypothetical protein